MTKLAILFFILLIFAIGNTLAKCRLANTQVSLVMAFPCLIALEAILLNFLSVFKLVNSTSLVVAHLIILSFWMAWGYYYNKNRKNSVLHISNYFGKCIKYPAYYAVIPMIILVFIAALVYPPNTYDSLVYHMSRVVRWIENGSVAYFPTAIDRQNVMGPGAEYLILFLQAISDSDALANFVQFFAFLFIILGLSHLVRIIRIPQRWAAYIVILTATAPMAIMQASSTKNDLVASLMTVSIIISSKRIFLGDIRKLKIKGYLLIGICISAGYLVKPTSIIVCLPLLICAAFLKIFALKTSEDLKKIMVGICVLVLTISLIDGPDIFRKITNNVSRHEVYPILSQYDVDRLWNPLRGLAQNIPFPNETKKILNELGYNGILRTNNVVNVQEDMVGNPFQVLSFIFCLVLSVFLIPFVFTKRLINPFLLAMYPAVAWYSFGLIVRDQPWLTRLQLPLITLLPFSFILFRQFNKFTSKIFTFLVFIFSMSSLAYGTLTAANVPPRLLNLALFWGDWGNRVNNYYNNVGLQKEHDFLFTQAEEKHCSRIGLILGDSSVEYPISWRAHLKSLETRHLWKSTQEIGESTSRTFTFLDEQKDWACILYVASGSREAVPMLGKQWLSVKDNYHTHIRNFEWEYLHSKTVCFEADASELLKKIESANGMQVTAENDAILITAINDDPFFIISDVNCTEGHSAIMKIEIKSNVNTHIKVYYQTQVERSYKEKNILKADIKIGANTVYFFLPSDSIIGSIRIDPGAQAGIYELSSIGVHRVEKINEATEPDQIFHIRME
ncbi:MAG: hypothetical protein V2B20_02650 [Pseudomonadota bacterium]